jgi:hypothetical protein
MGKFSRWKIQGVLMRFVESVLISLTVIGLIPAIGIARGDSIVQENNGIIISSLVLKSTKDSIQGDWNLEQAQQIIFPHLEKHKWRDNAVEHKFLRQYKLPYRKKDVRLIATSSIRKESDCHACAPDLSFFEFEKQSRGWKLVSSSIAVCRWGSWGKIEPRDIKVKIIGNNGDNTYGVILEGGSTNMGISTESISVYARVGSFMREILPSTYTHFNTDGYDSQKKNDWNSKVTILSRTKGYFDILLERKGIRDGKTFSERELFKFNGTKYVSQKSQRAK